MMRWSLENECRKYQKLFNKYLRVLSKKKVIFLIYLLNLLLWIGGIIVKFYDINFLKIISTFLKSFQGWVLLHISFLIFLFLFLFIRWHYKAYFNKGASYFLCIFFKYTVLPCLLIIGIFIANQSYNNSEVFKFKESNNFNLSKISNDHYSQDAKIRGVSAFSLNQNDNKISSIVENNIEWVAIHPYLYQNNENDTIISSVRERWSKKDSVFATTIDALHSKKVHIMLKPHLWVVNGKRNNITFSDGKEWDSWFQSYSNMLIFYAKFAQRKNIELLCIGTELDETLMNHTKDWILLIKKIRQVYSGQLTYAMNWDTVFFDSKFWNKLDYIGVQAYYPLTQNNEPTLNEIKRGWITYKENLEKISNHIQKPILFTEIGYRNDIYATLKPWEWSNPIRSFFRKKSNKTQYFAYQAIFEEVWQEPWFSGMFIWQWDGEPYFSINNKPSQNLIMDHFSKNTKH